MGPQPQQPPIKPPRSVLPKFSDRLALGKGGLEVSPICIGLVIDEDTYSTAFDLGINFFFITADMHWPIYEASRQSLRKLLSRRKGIRDEIVVACVSYTTQPEFCSFPFEEALQEVPSLRRFDVLVAGGAYSYEIMTRSRIYQTHCLGNYCGAQAIGTTCHDRGAATSVINHQIFDICFIRYNPAHSGARYDVFPRIEEGSSTLLFNFKSTTGYVPPDRLIQLSLTDEHWMPEITDHYKFALARPEIAGVLCGFSAPQHIEALRDALAGPPLTEEEENYMINIAKLDLGKAKLKT